MCNNSFSVSVQPLVGKFPLFNALASCGNASGIVPFAPTFNTPLTSFAVIVVSSNATSTACEPSKVFCTALPSVFCPLNLSPFFVLPVATKVACQCVVSCSGLVVEVIPSIHTYCPLSVYTRSSIS